MTLHPSDVPSIDVRQAAARLEAGGSDGGGPLLVDVRERHEFAAVGIAGAVLAPASSFLVHVRALPRDRPLLVICRSGSRSAAVASFLLREGFSDVSNVTGGLSAWLQAGLPVRQGTPAAGEGELPEGEPGG